MKRVNEYSCADIVFSPSADVPTATPVKKKNIGFICGVGINKREILNNKYSIAADKTICYLYIGGAGANNHINWKNLKKLTDYVFITKDNIAAVNEIENIINIGEELTYIDMLASSDIVCAKLGYSTLALSLKYRKPLFFCSHSNFYEFEFLKKFLDNNVIEN